MTWKEHLIYWIIPVIAGWLFALAYFAGPRWLQNIVAHPFNRELGLLEHVENVLLIAVIIFCIYLLRRSGDKMIRGFYLLCTIAFIFLFLEEIDYGFHYINYYRDVKPGEDSMVRNFHNREKGTISKMMWICYAALAFILVVPFIKKDRLPSWIHDLVPTLRTHFTILAIPLVSRFPFLLHNMDLNTNMSLHDNLSEFEEVMIYYIFLLYFWERFKLSGRRRTSNRESSTGMMAIH